MKYTNRQNIKVRVLAMALSVLMVFSCVPLEVFAQGNGEYELELSYDDHFDVSGKTVEIIDAGEPTSYQVGYGVEENTLCDTAVVALEGDAMVATGIGTAKVKIDGQTYDVTVKAAPISLILLAGQSNMQGTEGNADQSIICPDGEVYATCGNQVVMNETNATNFAASALTGYYRDVNVNGTSTNLSGYPIYSLNEAGAGRIGPDSGFGYEWVNTMGEKVWVVNAAHGGSAISSWLKGGANYKEAVALFGACQETLRKEIKAGHYELSHMGYYWCQGCADETQTAEWYVNKYLAMHEGLKTALAADMDSDASTPDVTLEFGGIIPIRSGHQNAGSYRAGTYTDTTTASYFTSFMDLRMNGPRVAQYWMGNNPELTDIWNVCAIQEEWVTFPDGSDGVEEYFREHYTDGKVDYEPQKAQSASWYTPKTPAAVHDSIHYNQIGYNEIGREAVRNTAYYLGQKTDTSKPTVEFVGWDGFTPVTDVTSSTVGASGTLVVPAVNPVYKSKDVTYTVSEGLNYKYYDLLGESSMATGTVTAKNAIGNPVTVNERELTEYRWNFDGLTVTSVTEDGFKKNALAKLGGSISNGLMTNGRYQMAESVALLHDEPWLVEWSIAGDWSGMILSSTGTSATTGMNFLFKTTGTTGFIGFGEYRSGSYHNYGVTIKELGLDMTKAHVYRLENRVNNDGTNMIYLSVDGVEVGAMNNYYIGGTNNQNKKVDWVSGRDFNFAYVGSSGHAMQKCDLNYLVVDEDGAEGEVHYHDYCDWYEVTVPTETTKGIQRRDCSTCEEYEIREVEGVWTKLNLMDHLSELPEKFCSNVNLWAELEHDPQYYANGIDWGVHSSGKVYSITFPVENGDQIYASSFGKAGTNGTSGTNGIRCTFFDAYGVAKTMAPAEVYAEFSADGYLTAPEGAVAINVSMWTNSDAWEVYVKNVEHDYVDGVCEACGDRTMEPELLEKYKGKVISIMGDSISTFAGYIPVADGFNLEHLARYPQDNLLTDVNETWWMQVIETLDAKLGINDSWRGATVSGGPAVTTGVTGPQASMANLTRIQNLGSNGTPDVILFYGGTNDLAHVSKVGTFDPATTPSTVDLTTAKWDNLADGYVNALLRMKHYYPDAEIVAMLPTYTTSYYTNAKLAEANEVLAAICEHYNVAYVDLRDCGITTADLPDGIHPGTKGMDYITDAVLETLALDCDVTTGETVVHSVRHELTNATATLGHWKGITSGEAFVETVTGEGELIVTVTMGGKDITSTAYANGTITIPTVTGDVVVTAKAKFSLGEHLQQLPEQFCCGVNLWTELEHDKYYYTEKDGWGINSLGTVYSITFPVEAGDQIYASSFGKAGTNGYASVNGIRCTFFGEDGVLITMSPAQVYAEFSTNGYLTAPEGAVAVNVPMWTNSDDWEVYVKNAGHKYGEWIETKAPTETAKGEERRDCDNCDAFETRDVDALGEELPEEPLPPSGGIGGGGGGAMEEEIVEELPAEGVTMSKSVSVPMQMTSWMVRILQRILEGERNPALIFML